MIFSSNNIVDVSPFKVVGTLLNLKQLTIYL